MKRRANERYKETSDQSSKRQKYRTTLITAWIKTKHPSVWEAIRDEAYRKYPAPATKTTVNTRSEIQEALKSIAKAEGHP
jgi:hypothetical protein